ncbi:MAG: sugar ABC transporter permease [Oscillospiraceae bacterium]|nr:sugar ABC transporter permease [Oscillospiraceae bacterium]
MRDQTQIQKKSLKKKLEPWSAYLWMAPTIILVLLFVMMPVVNTFIMAFSEVSRSGLIKDWNNFENFKFVFEQEVFPRVMLNTVVWVIIIVSVCMVLSLALALILNEKFKGRKFVRTVLLLPWATSQFIFACAWRYIFNYEFGNLNALLIQLGIIEENINWLGTANSAFACMTFVGFIVTIPFMTFTLLSGLTAISNDYYEAATIDGAGFWQKLFHITLPLLKPAINVTVVLNTIYVFNSFTIIHTITNGAPANQSGTIMTYMYYLAFSREKSGAAAAISVLGFIVLLTFAIIYMNTQMKEEQ